MKGKKRTFSVRNIQQTNEREKRRNLIQKNNHNNITLTIIILITIIRSGGKTTYSMGGVRECR